MNKVFSLLALVLVLGWTTPALANQYVDAAIPGWDQMSPAQKAQIQLDVAKRAERANSTIVAGIDVKPEKVEPWLKLIDSMGKGLVGLAKDLGVTANELLTTPVGMITVGLIAYKVMGQDIAGVLVGLLFISIAFPIWLLWFYKTVIPVVEHKKVTRHRWLREPVMVDVPVRRASRFGGGSGTGPEWMSLILLFFIGISFVIFIA